MGSYMDFRSNINETFSNNFGSVGWPKCGEIDIIEQNGWNKSIAYGTFHWADSQTDEYFRFGEEKSVSNMNLSSLSNNFHLYSLIWEASSLKILIDNKHLASLTNSSRVPFDNPHYILLNLEWEEIWVVIYHKVLRKIKWRLIL